MTLDGEHLPRPFGVGHAGQVVNASPRRCSAGWSVLAHDDRVIAPPRPPHRLCRSQMGSGLALQGDCVLSESGRDGHSSPAVRRGSERFGPELSSGSRSGFGRLIRVDLCAATTARESALCMPPQSALRAPVRAQIAGSALASPARRSILCGSATFRSVRVVGVGLSDRRCRASGGDPYRLDSSGLRTTPAMGLVDCTNICTVRATRSPAAPSHG